MSNPSAAAKRSTKPIRNRIRKPTGFSLMIWAQRHPFLSLAGVWLIMMLLGWFALNGLTYTNSAPLEVAAPQPEAQESQRVQPDKPATSFGLLVMVSVTCAAASGLLARRLRPVKPAPRRAIKPIKPTTKPRSRSPRQAPPIAPPTPAITPPIPQPAQATIVQPRSPMITLTPPDEDDSLDWGEANLISRFDSRKRDSAIELPRLN